MQRLYTNSRQLGPRHTRKLALLGPAVVLLLVLCQTETRGQTDAQVILTTEETTAPSIRTVSTADALESLQRAILSNEAERTILRNQLKMAENDDQRAEIEDALSKLKTEGIDLQGKFESTATDSVAVNFERDDLEELDLQTELARLLLPILSELKVATGASRELAALRHSLARESERFTLAQSAAVRATELANATTNALMIEHLQGIADSWARKAQAKQAEVSALRYELDQRNSKRKSFFALSHQALKQFFSTRGRNLVLSMLAFTVVLLLFRWGGRTATRWTEARPSRSTFAVRLAHLIVHALSILAAIAALLLTLNFTGDWFLLGIVILFLIGAGWGMLKTLPNIYEQLKLILNLGAVRENELMTFDGVPWKVESLGFMAQLVNPALDGGQVDLPIRELVGHHSRAMGHHEPLFPTEKGDWVLLNGSTHAKVITQTPTLVEVLERGGARTAIPTGDFLAMHPVNLSHNYRVSVVFGVDYQHQALCTTEIPARMQAVIEEGLATELPGEDIINVQVRFLQAGASSLDYELMADIRGSSADRYRDVVRALSRLAVDACNLHGWVIPFTQITLHQAVPQ